MRSYSRLRLSQDEQHQTATAGGGGGFRLSSHFDCVSHSDYHSSLFATLMHDHKSRVCEVHGLKQTTSSRLLDSPKKQMIILKYFVNNPILKYQRWHNPTKTKLLQKQTATDVLNSGHYFHHNDCTGCRQNRICKIKSGLYFCLVLLVHNCSLCCFQLYNFHKPL